MPKPLDTIVAALLLASATIFFGCATKPVTVSHGEVELTAIMAKVDLVAPENRRATYLEAITKAVDFLRGEFGSPPLGIQQVRVEINNSAAPIDQVELRSTGERFMTLSSLVFTPFRDDVLRTCPIHS